MHNILYICIINRDIRLPSILPVSVNDQNYWLNFSRFILTAWMLALLPTVPNIFIFETTQSGQKQAECVSNFEGWDTTVKKVYFTLVFLLIFVIPLVFVECLSEYLIIFILDNHTDLIFSYNYTT